MKIVKPTPDEFEALLNFLNASEAVLDKEKFSFASPEDNWEEWDEDNADKILITKIQKEVAEDLGYGVSSVDSRIVMYEFLKHKFSKAFRWRGVYWAAEALLENIQDPFDDCLAFHPCFQINHVENEQ